MEKIRWHHFKSKSIDDSILHLKLDASPIQEEEKEKEEEPRLRLLKSDPGLGRGRLDENEDENEKNKDWLPLRRDVFEEGGGGKNRLKNAIQQQPLQGLDSGGAADYDDDDQQHHSQSLSQDASSSSSKGEEMSEKRIYGGEKLRKLKRALKKVADLRDGLYGKRLKLRERRNELRQELSILSEADANFMKAVRQYFSSNDHHHHVFTKKEGDFEDQEEEEEKEKEKYYTDMEQQRDVVGSLQYEYDQEEDEHDVVENELLMEEEKLSMMVSKFLDHQQGNVDDKEALRSNPSSGRHHQLQEEELEEEEEERRYFPKTEKEVAIEEYQSRQGDARIMQERLADLLAEEDLRRDFAKKRENLGGWGLVEESEEEGDFAEEEFNYQFREMESELEIIQADVRRLKNDLLQSGYLEASEPASTIQPEAASLFSPLPPIEPPPTPPRIQAQSPVQIGRNRAKSDSIAPLVEKEISTARVRERRVSHWILVTFGSSTVEQWQQNAILRDLEVEVIGGELLEEKKTWARTTRLVFDRLKKKRMRRKKQKQEQKQQQQQQQYDELGDEDEPQSSWDEIGQQDLLSYTPTYRRASQPGDYVFLKGMLEVEQAVNRLEEQFPFPDQAEKKHNHKIPYGQSALRMDLHPEYESRSC